MAEYNTPSSLSYRNWICLIAVQFCLICIYYFLPAEAQSQVEAINSDEYDLEDQNTGSNANTSNESNYRYPPPELKNPITITIEANGGFYPGDKVLPRTSTKIKMENGRMIASPIGSTPRPEFDNSQYYFPFDRDVEILIKTPFILKQPIVIFGGRNVAIRGVGDSYITKEPDPRMPQLCDHSKIECQSVLTDYKPDTPAAIIVDSPRNSILIENIKLQLNGNFTDGFVFRQNKATDPRPEGVDVFIRNVEAHGIGGNSYAIRGHGDIVQLQSGTYRNLFFEKIIGSTGYQGFFMPNRPNLIRKKQAVVVSTSPLNSNKPKPTPQPIQYTYSWIKNPYLCSQPEVEVTTEDNLKKRQQIEICTPEIVVKGEAYFRNVVLGPLSSSICPHCINPYIGLYTSDMEYDEEVKMRMPTAPPYRTILNQVTFFRDPRRSVNTYVVPQPPQSTVEGLVNMTVATARTINGKKDSIIKGKLLIISK